MVLSRRDTVLAVSGGLVAWLLIGDLFPVLRYVSYSFIAGSVFSLLGSVALILFNVRSTEGGSQKLPCLAGSAVGFLSPDRWKGDLDAYKKAREYEPPPLYAQSFIVSEGLDDLLRYVLRDFITSWYKNISSNTKFQNELDRTIRHLIFQIGNRTAKVDMTEVFVARIVPILTAHLREFGVAERAVRGKNLTRTVTETEELDNAIAKKYNDGKLHPAACGSLSDPQQAQQEYIRKLIATLLPTLLPKEQRRSRAVAVLLREVFSCALLAPLLKLLAQPDTWNRLVEAYGRTALHDRKTVRKLRAALDQHAPAPKSKHSQPFPRLAPHASERDFERFVRAIRRCNNISDARRFRNYVSSQLKRESTIENQDPVYLKRLETGKRVLDQKIARLTTLSGYEGTARPNTKELQHRYYSKIDSTSLVDLMHDASGLSYYMEYMDRLGKMSLVQYWVVVDGFRNPLEDDFGDESVKLQWTSADRNDIILINETYLNKRELRVPADARRTVKEFIDAGKKASSDQYRRARTVILTTQSAVLEEMQNKYYPDFKKSDLYYKYLASDEAAASSATTSEVPTAQPQPQSRQERRPLTLLDSHKKPELRRSNTATQLSSMPRSSLESDRTRLSVDSERTPLFDDDIENNPLSMSSHSFGRESIGSGEAESIGQSRVLENMEAALNDIIAGEPTVTRDPSKSDITKRVQSSPMLKSAVSSRPTSSGTDKLDKGKPNIASLGLVNPVGRIGVFTDNDLFPDEEKFIEDEYADPVEEEDEDSILKEVQPAEPGDLGLAEAISALTNDIEKLIAQESVVDALTKKAELTNNAAELRILGKSKSSLQREIRRKEMQRQQYMIQESDTGLYGRAAVHIKSIIIGKEEDGHEYASYLIEVQRKAGDQMPSATWVVARRYSEFHELHTRLRSRYAAVRALDFPRRRVVMKLQKDFLQKRRVALEAYLQGLLLLPEVCRSRELRSFLSQRAIAPSEEETASRGEEDNKDIVTRIYNSVADGMDDFVGNIAVLDQLSTAGQNLINQFNSSTQPALLGLDHLSTEEDSVSAAEAEAELNAFEDRELEPFVKPICDIFLELFELNRGNNWLRGRAVVVVLHQLLGGTVERKVRDTAKSFFSDASLLRYIGLAKDTFWPGGGPLRLAEKRTLPEEMKSRAEASVMLATLVPELAASVVGRANAQEAARKIFATLNNERLNVHLLFTILDELVLVLFGNR
ncbi:Intermediate filament protein [Ascosphaera atra]|nr:Intermediate filament protein [Ascosphaera atra]